MIETVGWALVHFVWQGTVIAAVLAAVLPLCRRATARYGAACVAMLAMLAVFGATLVLSVPDQDSGARFSWTPPADGRADGSGMAGAGAGMVERVRELLPWLVPFWMAGAVVIGAYRLGGWMTAQRLRRIGVCGAATEWEERLGRLARRMGVSRPLRLLESSLAEAPVVIGFVRPVILAPVGLLASLPAEQVEAILLHELAHIRRCDYLVNLAQTLAESLLFYHPAVWWVSGVMRTEREHCCDDAVVAVQGDARGYAAALVTLEGRRAGREPVLAATGGDLMIRIRRLLRQPEEPGNAAALIVSMGLLLGMFCLLAAAQQSREAETPHQRWLKEDVVYIIRDEEGAAFERLKTHEEREQFIRQFWQRRDPTPGTAANEVQEEHYRRIAYANQRFRSAQPGWTTDRGRIYIVHGPPDEIESHPGIVEKWRYRRIDGIGEDVIFEFRGQLQLTGPPSVKRPANR